MECIVLTAHCLGDNKFILGFCGNETKTGPSLIILSLNLMVISSVFFAQALKPCMNLSVLKLNDTGSGSIWQVH